jgi:hypothetical protein
MGPLKGDSLTYGPILGLTLNVDGVDGRRKGKHPSLVPIQGRGLYRTEQSGRTFALLQVGEAPWRQTLVVRLQPTACELGPERLDAV